VTAYPFPRRELTITADGRALVVCEGGGGGAVRTNGQQLSRRELAEIAALFDGWEQLDPKYPIMVDGPEFTITFAGRTVIGSDWDAPEPFNRVRIRLMDLSTQLVPP
jgi:hypothetical protein